MRPWIPLLLRRARAQLGLPPGPPDRLRAEELNLVVPALHRLSGGLSGERGKAGAVYLDEARLGAAYLLHFWPISYAMGATALAGGWLPAGAAVLELGCGPGPLTAALLDAGAGRVHAVDHSAAALEAVGALFSAGRVTTARWDGEGGALPGEGLFDLIAMSHLLNELWKREPDRIARRVGLLEGLRSRLGESGEVLIIEPAAHAINAELLALRDALVARGWVVRAPCFTQRPCPALAAGAACHAAVAGRLPELSAQLAAAAHIDRARPGFGYLRLAPPGARPAEVDPGTVRILSEPMVNKAGRVRRVVCGAAGRFTLSGPAAGREPWRATFEALRRGQSVHVEGAESRESGLGLGPNSQLHVSGPGGAGRRR